MERLEVALPDVPKGVVVRPQPDAGSQTLVFFQDSICVLEGGQGDSPFTLGPKLQLRDAATGGEYTLATNNYKAPQYDPTTKCVYFYDGQSVMQLDDSNTVSLVAGHKDDKGHADGVGADARFNNRYFQATDGSGSLYVSECADGTQIRKVVLSVAASGPGTVSTLPAGAVKLRLLAYSTASNQLLAASETALYHVPLPPHTLATSWGAQIAPISSIGFPILLAGQEGVKGSCDGVGSTARFAAIRGLMVAPDGRSAYLLDAGSSLRKMDMTTRSVTTLTTLMTTLERFSQLVLLPQGCLAVSIPQENNKKLHILKAPEFAQSAPIIWPASPSRRQRKLLDLLAQAPSGGPPAIVNIRMGDRVYPAHRAVLADRSPYFERLLEGSFAEGSAAEVELQDTDPDTFARLLDCMYTGALDVPEQHLRGTVELAGRLLLDEVSVLLQRRLLAGVTPSTVVRDLVWAQRLGLTELVTGLKERAIVEFRRVAAVTPKEDLMKLAAEYPELMAETVKAFGDQVA